MGHNYSNMLKQYFIDFLHSSDNRNEPNKTDERYNQLWKMRAIFDNFIDSYAQHYSPTKHLATEEITVLFKGTVIIKQYTPKKYKQFGTKLYKLCDFKGCTLDTTMHLWKDRKCATPSMTADMQL